MPLNDTLIAEAGVPGEGVCFWRRDRSVSVCVETTVGEFLSRPENQSGDWCIDGGWGGPPGPIIVRWDAGVRDWINGGYNGRRLDTQEGEG